MEVQNTRMGFVGNVNLEITQTINLEKKMRNLKIENAWKLIHEKKVKFISRSEHLEIWECGEYKVIFQNKAGRELFSCDCKNWTSYCIEKPICKHFLAVMFTRMMRFKKD